MMCLYDTSASGCDHRGTAETLSRHETGLFGIPTHEIIRYGCFVCGYRLGYERLRLPGGVVAGFVALVFFGIVGSWPATRRWADHEAR